MIERIKSPTHVVSIWRRNETNHENYICDGFLLEDNLVVTAAHCLHGVDFSTIHIQIGSVELNAIENVRYVDEVRIHSGYEWKLDMNGIEIPMKNDIAAINFWPPILLNCQTKLASLYNNEIKLGMIGEVTGWGNITGFVNNPKQNIHILLQTKMEIIQQPSQGFPYNIQKFSAQDLAGKSIMNIGDGGSPFMINGAVVGILSEGNQDPNGTALFTNLLFYSDWLEDSRIWASYRKSVRNTKPETIPNLKSR